MEAKLCAKENKIYFYITQISASSIHITSELDINLSEENQYRSRLLAGTLMGGVLAFVLGELRAPKRMGSAPSSLAAQYYLFLICMNYVNFAL